MKAHHHTCDCMDCLNRGGGVAIDLRRSHRFRDGEIAEWRLREHKVARREAVRRRLAKAKAKVA